MSATEKSPNDTVLLEVEAVDWRVADEAADELTDMQRLPWKLEVKPAGFPGLLIVATAPDGTQRNLTIEIDKGNLSIAMGGDPELDNHTVVKLGQDKAVMEAVSGFTRSFAVADSEGLRIGTSEIEPGCTGPTTPTP